MLDQKSTHLKGQLKGDGQIIPKEQRLFMLCFSGGKPVAITNWKATRSPNHRWIIPPIHLPTHPPTHPVFFIRAYTRSVSPHAAAADPRFSGAGRGRGSSPPSPDAHSFGSPGRKTKGHYHLPMGQNPNRTPSEPPNPHYNRLKWVVHLAQNILTHGHLGLSAVFVEPIKGDVEGAAEQLG